MNATLGVQTPEIGEGIGAALVEGWRVSGILRAQSGAPLTVSTGQDRAMTGLVTNQRGNLVLDDPYLDDELRWLNPAAFAQPALGTYGDTTRGQFRGPSRWSVDVVMARLFRLANAQQIELRAEAFNVLNTVRLEDPVTNLSNRNFGRILGIAGDMRVMQFAVKYGF